MTIFLIQNSEFLNVEIRCFFYAKYVMNFDFYIFKKMNAARFYFFITFILGKKVITIMMAAKAGNK